MSDLKIVDYTEKSFVVLGDTKPHKTLLKELGGKYNPNLKVGAGWIFSKKKKKDVKKALKQVKIDSMSSSNESSEEKTEPEIKVTISTPSLSDGDCVKKYGKPPAKKTAKLIEEIEAFCNLLNNNRVKDGKIVFLKLPLVVQCLFLNYSWQILSKKSKYSDESYLSAFRMFKLFRSKEFKDKPIYAKYLKMSTVETNYKKALDWNKKSSPSKASPSSGGRKSPQKYDKKFQRRPEPESEEDPLFIFYTTLYEQKKDSPLAITWLTEHGIFEGKKRSTLEKAYEKLANKKKLIR